MSSFKGQRSATKNQRSHARNTARQLERREAHEASAKIWRSLSLQEQLKRLPANGAKRQRARIISKLNQRAAA
jgi:hypothetical protein